MFKDLLIDLKSINPARKSLIYNAIFCGSFHLICLHRLSRFLYFSRLRPLGRLVADLCRVFYCCDIHPEAQIAPGIVFVHPFCIVIGAKATIGKRCKIYNGVTIGNRKGEHSDGMAVVGDDVFIGTGAKLLGEIHIGNRARIGANSVVLKDVPDDSVAIGVPAVIRANG